MLKMKRSPLVMLVLAMTVVLSLLGAFFHHHHEDAHTEHECSACRLIQTLSLLLLFTAVLLGFQLIKKHEFPWFDRETFQSIFLSYSLKDRAPPVSFS